MNFRVTGYPKANALKICVMFALVLFCMLVLSPTLQAEDYYEVPIDGVTYDLISEEGDGGVYVYTARIDSIDAMESNTITIPATVQYKGNT